MSDSSRAGILFEHVDGHETGFFRQQARPRRNGLGALVAQRAKQPVVRNHGVQRRGFFQGYFTGHPGRARGRSGVQRPFARFGTPQELVEAGLRESG